MKQDDPDVELTGILVSNGSAKAYQFLMDFGEPDPVWVPRSQAEWLPDLDSDEKRGTMKVRAWLAKRNGWQ